MPRPALSSLPLALASLAGLAGCGYEPATPTFRFEASAETRAGFSASDLDDPDLAAARIGGALELLFGTPQHPGFHVPADWRDEERDPNDTWFELSDPAVDAVRADNERRFAAQLAAIAAAPAGAAPLELPRPSRAGAGANDDVIWDRWSAAFEPVILGEVALEELHPDSPSVEEAEEDWPTFTWREEASRWWRSYYPALAESAELYRVRCLTCHGSSGDGDGPTGRYLDPRPRDFRDGIFKWVSVEANRRPTRDDLVGVLRSGVRGSAMPSFRRLSRGELEGLVDWVRFLAVRGETEKLAVYYALEDGAVDPGRSVEAYGLAWRRWDEAGEYVGAVPVSVPLGGDDETARAERITRGEELFRGQLANCASCHGANGEGDGEAIWETNDAGERVPRPDRWGQPSRPRNFRAGVFRGGDRPADLYRRIKYGIGGTIMPAADASLSDDDVWSLVDYVLSLSGPAQEAGV